MTTRPVAAGPGTISPLGTEALDSPDLDAATARATLRDIARANRLFGGTAAVQFGVGQLLADARPHRLALADVGAGAGDVLQAVARRLERRGVRVTAVAVDFHREAARLSRATCAAALQADAFQLPLADASVDVAIASQLLHHYAPASVPALLTELSRIARIGVVVGDLRRATAAAWGIWMAATALRFHPVSRADGVLSVRRGFTARELEHLCRTAGCPATVHRRPGFRLVALWRTDRANR